jgi:hypothetical protein
MAKVTIVVGVLLMLVGAVAFFVLGHHLHTLIPVGFGVVIAFCGVRAESPVPKTRMLWMHIAVTLGLLGFLGTIPGIIATIRRALGQVVVSPVVGAAAVQAIMGTICLVYVALCVRSFIAARRLRNA